MQGGQISQNIYLQLSFYQFLYHLFLLFLFPSSVLFFTFALSYLLPSLLQVFDLHSGPKPVVFVLHSFLSAKLTRMGLLTWKTANKKSTMNDRTGPGTARRGKDSPKKLILAVVLFCFFLISIITAEVRPEVVPQGRLNPWVVLLIVSKMCLLFRVSSISCSHSYCEARWKGSGTLLEVRNYWGRFKAP